MLHVFLVVMISIAILYTGGVLVVTLATASGAEIVVNVVLVGLSFIGYALLRNALK